MRHIWWVLGLKKNSPLIAVRIEVLCFYTFFNNFNFFEFSGYPIEAHSRGSQFSICVGFLAVIFGLAGVRICKGITLKSAFFQNRINFLKNCNFFVVFRISNGITLKRQSISVNFWKKSTRFAGFLAMIFTSKWLLASGNHWGLRNAKKILQKFINFEKILEISEKFSIIFVVFRISNRSTLKRQSIFIFF